MNCRAAFAGTLALLLSGAAASAAPSAAEPCLVGMYDGGAMEIAAGLELAADGRFRYGLSYGALDESAAGRWQADDAAVYLTTDPFTPPNFALVSDSPTPDRMLELVLETPPGLSAQYFEAEIIFTDGRTATHQLGDDGLRLPMQSGDHVVSITLAFPVFGLTSGRLALAPAAGQRVVVRFDANDLGVAGFDRTMLRRNGVRLELERHGRLLRFRPDPESSCAGDKPN